MIGRPEGTVDALYGTISAADTTPSPANDFLPDKTTVYTHQSIHTARATTAASRNAVHVGSGSTIHVGFTCSLNADAQLHLPLNGSPDTDDPGLVSPALGIPSNIAHVSPCSTSSASSFDVGNPHRRRLSRHQPAHRQLAVRSSPTARHAQLANQ